MTTYNGVDHLEYDHFGLNTPSTGTVCTRKVPGEPVTYCGKSATIDYHPDNHKDSTGRSKYMQHCLPCDREYRKTHDGRLAATV